MTAAELRAQLQALNARAHAAQARIDAIRPARGFDGAGPERQAAMASGNLDAIRALDAEHTDVVLMRESLATQTSALGVRLTEAVAREAAESMPTHHAALKTRVVALEAAQAALAQAWQALDAAYRTAWQTRIIAQRGGHDPAPASATLVDRLAASARLGCNTPSRLARLPAHEIADELGVTHQQRSKAA